MILRMWTRLLPLLLLASSLPAQDWPAFRGPTNDGIAPVQQAPLSWSPDSNIKWRTPLDQAGNGSPIVSNGRVFLTMPEDEGGKRRSLICLDRKDGLPIWVRTVDFGKVMPTHDTNPHCSSTPVADGERVVVWHASAGLHCYDFEGEQLWSRDLGEFTHQWGMGTSPILHEGIVILNTGPGPESFVAAFDLETGETLWKTVEPSLLTAEQIEKKRLVGTWSTPLVHRVGDRDLVICGQPTRIVAYDANTGEIVWYCKGLACDRGDLVYSSPVVVGDVCMVMGGYVGPSIGVRMDGEGDVSESHLVWYNKDEMSNCASGVAVDGHVYIPEMDGWLRCIDGTSGETMWRERIGRGQTWGSIVLVDGLLFMTNQRGTTYVFEPNPDGLEILAENAFGEVSNSTPAFAGGEIVLRTQESVYCVSVDR